MAFLIIGMLGVGLYMVRLPASLDKLTFYGMHKEVGMLVLMLATLRLIWRFKNAVPSLKGLPQWEAIGARLSHVALYFFMFAMPMTGWMLTSRAGFPISFFGLFVIPTLAAPDTHQRELFGEVHKYFAYTLIMLLALHIAAALKHHFFDKDTIFKRMLVPPNV
jgi:cytochrome b561